MSPSSPPAVARSGSLWRHGDFVKLWGAYALSLAGSQVTFIALPLTAILLLEATPLQVGILTALGYLPFLLIGLPAGVWVDRLPRRPILIAADFGRALFLLGIPLAYALDVLSLGVLYPIVFLNGVLTVFADIAHHAFLPALVEREQIIEGNTKLQMAYSTAQLAGPSLGGLLVKAVSAPVAILIDAASFLVSALMLLRVRRQEAVPEGRAKQRPPMRQEMKEGLGYVLGHPLLRPLVLCMACANLFDMFGMVKAILPLYAVREMRLSAPAFGAVLAVANAGALLGTVLNHRLVRRWGLGPTLAGASFLPGLAVLMLPLATEATAVGVLAGALALAGFGVALFNVNQISLRQQLTPASLQGRMNATVRFLIWGTIPAGAFLGGLLGGSLGLKPTLLIAGVGSLLSSLPLVFSPLATLHEPPQPALASTR
ncbi:MAG TPA: MFS transporter [Archangium sp.]|uniref:MFS transporter n=1 Tax=Archangium sp. TaxID=1872627 RepID=UPI002E2F7665|nr:MFS transporter [Archangium sp.]HEX5751155.1 MFS transporter [Archangium sp.]